MKKILLFALACVIYESLFGQVSTIGACCNIISVNDKNNNVLTRNKNTGQLYQFKADRLDIETFKLNDEVTIAGGKITSIRGAIKAYSTIGPNYVGSCCTVVSIEPEAVGACCNIVTFKNNTTRAQSKFTAPKNISGTLKAGSKVYIESIAETAIDSANGMAIVQSSYGNSKGKMNFYGYPIIPAD